VTSTGAGPSALLDLSAATADWPKDVFNALGRVVQRRTLPWTHVTTIVVEKRLGTTDPHAVSAWFHFLDRQQITSLALWPHPFQDAHLVALDCPPGRAVAGPVIQDAQMVIDQGGVSDLVYYWRAVLGDEAAIGYASGVTLTEAITARDAGTLVTLRGLAALRNPVPSR
jgi:hypothetical protein